MVDAVAGAPTGPVDPSQRRLAATVARRHYLGGRSKTEIAAELDLSRFKVARLVELAHQLGIVRIQITEPDLEEGLSAQLADLLGVERCFVVDTEPSDHRVACVGAYAADYLRSSVPTGGSLGLAWSRSTQILIDHLHDLPPCTVVQLCGVLAHAAGEEHNVELVRRAAHNVGGGAAVTFYAPLVVPTAEAARALRQQAEIRHALRAADALSTAVIAVGQWNAGESTVHDALSTRERTALGRDGAVAETCGLLFTGGGALLDPGLQTRTVAVTASQLRRTRDVVALATEPERAPALRALTRSGLVTTVITHRQVAERVIADGASSPPRPRTPRTRRPAVDAAG